MYRSKCLVKKCTDPNSWSKRVSFKILVQNLEPRPHFSIFTIFSSLVCNLNNQRDLIIVFSGVLWFILTSFFGSITDNNVSDVFRRGVDAYYFSEKPPSDFKSRLLRKREYRPCQKNEETYSRVSSTLCLWFI